MADAGAPISSVTSPSSNTLKCRPLLCSQPCYSSLALQLPRSRPQIAARRRGTGYDSAMSRIDVRSRTDGLVQAYNSLNQSPCEVAAYLQSTCSGGSECSLVYSSTVLSPFSAFTVDPLPAGYQYAGPYVLGGGDLCKCNTVTYSLLSACGACQEDLWITYEFIMSFYTPPY